MIIQQLHDHRVNPDAFDTEQLLDSVIKLRKGLPYQVPIYDFKSHRRSLDSFRQLMLNAHRVNASDVIILEGILVFHDQRVRNLMNMKFFVDTVTFCLLNADVRLARRIRRDTIERGRDINSVLEQEVRQYLMCRIIDQDQFMEKIDEMRSRDKSLVILLEKFMKHPSHGYPHLLNVEDYFPEDTVIDRFFALLKRRSAEFPDLYLKNYFLPTFISQFVLSQNLDSLRNHLKVEQDIAGASKIFIPACIKKH